ncbi:BnaC02g43650D [Brassica napus]|uniref:BnaC02g43650D protein n=1 Tax=Brassica napus TaxID=3708 RepID=A0A078H8T7_BRANA|nr:BnaC02g43650D [Brassica napus]
MRICRGTSDGEGTNLIRRLEKLEDDLKTYPESSQGAPISETAALAQKNSEATRVLAAQQEILEKELGEIQKVLLAMQDQQRKQLELILTSAKNGKMFESSKQASD